MPKSIREEIGEILSKHLALLPTHKTILTDLILQLLQEEVEELEKLVRSENQLHISRLEQIKQFQSQLSQSQAEVERLKKLLPPKDYHKVDEFYKD